jgi:dipeptidyl aminopeptidase/acylaminoacyl peptidase
MRAAVVLLAFTLASGCKGSTAAPLGRSAEKALDRSVRKRVITFPSGALTLHGVIYEPRGTGPFPAILWNHGSYAEPMIAFEELGPTFAEHGWIFFGPFRRGQGSSSAAGSYIMDEIEKARSAGGERAGAREMVRLLAGEQLQDQAAGYEWLKQQPLVASKRIAVGGNSFGGVETVLGAARLAYCAGIDGSGGAQSWARTPELREAMMNAVRRSQAPMLFFQAENDFDLSPSRALAKALQEAGKEAELKIYPPFGRSSKDGHSFAWHGSSIWGADVISFLDQHCPP